MDFTKKFFITAMATTILVGCTVPGSHITVDDKQVVKSDSEKFNISQYVNIYPLVPSLVSQLKSDVIAQTNPALDAEIALYEYKVGPSDILNITVWDHPELTIPAGSYRSATEAGNWVRSDGTIFYPYIGSVYVQGKTVSQIQSIVTKRLSKYIENPQIDVNVASFRSQKVYITGEVDSPGTQPITDMPLTILEAINNAGGLEVEADWRNVSLTRGGEEISISLHALMQKGDLTQNHLLYSGDIVHIPRNDGQKVFVMGEVTTPKTLKIDRAGMSLTEALSDVGGINELQADATGVFVIRSDDTSNEKVANIYQLNIKDATAMVIGTEFELQPYDIVYVTAAPIIRWNRVIAQLLPTIQGVNQLSETGLNLRQW